MENFAIISLGCVIWKKKNKSTTQDPQKIIKSKDKWFEDFIAYEISGLLKRDPD